MSACPGRRVKSNTPQWRSGPPAGEAARRLVPLSVHGEWRPSSDRPDPVRLLEEQAATRVPELVPIRYGRMLVSPFTFYRGAAYLMASDLAGAPTHRPVGAALRRRASVQLRCLRRPRPAARLQRQRLRRDAARPVRVGRQAAGRQLRRRRTRSGFDAKQRKAINQAVGRGPIARRCSSFAQMKKLDVWYARLTSTSSTSGEGEREARARVKRFEKNIAKARSKDSMKAFDKLVAGRRRTTAASSAIRR